MNDAYNNEDKYKYIISSINIIITYQYLDSLIGFGSSTPAV